MSGLFVQFDKRTQMETDKKNSFGDSAILGCGQWKILGGWRVMENFPNDNILDWTARQLLGPIVKMIK